MSSRDLVWRRSSGLVVVSWSGEQEVVAYNKATGDLHILAALPALLLEILASGPLTTSAILEHVVNSSSSGSDVPADSIRLYPYLRRLQGLGLLAHYETDV